MSQRGPEYVTEGWVDEVWQQWGAFQERMEPKLEEYRNAMVRLSEVIRRDVYPTLRGLFDQLDPKVQARLRQGHPAHPRRQVIHKGGKP